MTLPMVIVGEAIVKPHYTSIPNQKFISTDKPARFPDGNKKLMQYFTQGVNYPTVERKEKQKKEIKVRFLVDKKGKVSNGEVIGNVSPETQQEILKVVNKLPEFIPAEQNGEKVDATVELPITFRMLNL